MKKLVFICISLLSSFAYSATDDVIKLGQSSNFNLKSCQNIAQLHASKPNKKEVDNFRIDHNGFISIDLVGKNSLKCYSFKYYPETSPNLNLSIKNNKLVILEMVGSTINGNWLEKTYEINLKNNMLLRKKSKLISYSTDESGKSHKEISDW